MGLQITTAAAPEAHSGLATATVHQELAGGSPAAQEAQGEQDNHNPQQTQLTVQLEPHAALSPKLSTAALQPVKMVDRGKGDSWPSLQVERHFKLIQRKAKKGKEAQRRINSEQQG